MDQVQIDIIDTEVLESGIETLLNTLMECIRELARDLHEHNESDQRPRQDLLRNSRIFQTEVHQIGVYPLQHVPRYDTTCKQHSCHSSPHDWKYAGRCLTKRNRDVYTHSLTHAQRRR